MPVSSCLRYLTLLWTQGPGYGHGSSVCHCDSLTRPEADQPIAVQLLAAISLYILSGKVRSRALLFIYKLFFQLVYHAFYRNLVSEAKDLWRTA
jgi:hypothetical protein